MVSIFQERTTYTFTRTLPIDNGVVKERLAYLEFNIHLRISYDIEVLRGVWYFGTT